jgi:hypothetical protein
MCKCIYVFNKHLETKYSLHVANNLSQPGLVWPTVARFVANQSITISLNGRWNSREIKERETTEEQHNVE